MKGLTSSNKRKLVKKKTRLKKYPVIVDNENHHPLLELIKGYYRQNSINETILNLDKLPPSVNANYEKQIYKNHKTGRSFINQTLSPEVERYRILVRNHIVKNNLHNKPKTILAVIMEFHSHQWLNKDGTSKPKDIDNMVKPLFDAYEEATHIPDEIIHEFMAFKMHSDKEICKAYIFEIESKIYSK